MKSFILLFSVLICTSASALTLVEITELLSHPQTQEAMRDMQIYKIKEIGPSGRAAPRVFKGTPNETRVNYRALLVCAAYAADKVYHVTAIIPADLVYITQVHKIVKQTSEVADVLCQAQ